MRCWGRRTLFAGLDSRNFTAAETSTVCIASILLNIKRYVRMSVCLTGTKIFLDFDETLHGGGVLPTEHHKKKFPWEIRKRRRDFFTATWCTQRGKRKAVILWRPEKKAVTPSVLLRSSWIHFFFYGKRTSRRTFWNLIKSDRSRTGWRKRRICTFFLLKISGAWIWNRKNSMDWAFF